MDRIKKKLGFGCMRLPMKDGSIDEKQTAMMFDRFIEEGFNYFDTAHGYHSGLSEVMVRKYLTSRHPREDYLLTDKLTEPYFESEKDIRPFFEEQLRICGVDYFDFYLMHAQGAGNYGKFKRCRAYEVAQELKAEGKIRHVGLSFHDRAEVLDEILTDHPEVEVVQIQFNYLDFDDPAVQSERVYNVCRKHGKKVLIMEPVKGGSLASVPPDAERIFGSLGNASPASYALRFAAGFEDVICVLSGMSNMEQCLDNIATMKYFRPLDENETAAVNAVRDVIRSKNLISCTSCRYCTDGCPKHISIPDLFSCMNIKQLYHNWNADFYYNDVYTLNGGRASDCIKCRKCEKVCPQHLPIASLLEKVAAEFDK